MNRIWFVLVLAVIAKESFIMASASTPVAFSAVSTPRPWAVDDRAEYIVVTGKNWSKYYSSAPQGADFASSIYVVASMGTQPNPGYRIRIVQISQEGQRVQVTVERLNPDPKGMYPQVLVNPVAVAEVKRKDLESRPVLEFAFVGQNGQSLADVKVEF